MRLLAAAQRGRQLCSGGSSGNGGYFDVLQLQRSFDLNEEKLHKRYKQLMAECHPDRFGTASTDAQTEAAERSAAVTHAYSVLRKPHLRARHMLALLGAPLSEDNEGSELLGAEFLMQVTSRIVFRSHQGPQ